MKYIALAALLLSSAAMAQDLPAPAGAVIPIPQPNPAIGMQQPAEHLFYFEVTQADVQAIGTALNELPKRIADPLILKLNKQLELQAVINANYSNATTPNAITPPVKDADEKPERRRVRHHQVKP